MIQASMASERVQQISSIVSFADGSAQKRTDNLLVGRVKRMTLKRTQKLRYYLYLPHHLKQPARLFVTVHGISRNAREHAERFAPFAEEQGVILIAPIFNSKRFPGYQRLSDNDAGLRPDTALDEIVNEVRRQIGLPNTRLYLFGYSGGGQFVHRYLMAHPEKVERAVVGAAGWYTFPDPNIRYPRGLRPSTGQPFAITYPDFLRIPITVVVGEKDTYRDAVLNKSRRIDRQQGNNRLERGQRWIDAMTITARSHGYDTPYRFDALNGVDHDFSAAMVYGGMGELVFSHLFDEKLEKVSCHPCMETATAIASPRIELGVHL